MSDSAGRFVWYELMTTDTAKAEAFYRSVIGWDVAPFGGPQSGYFILSSSGQAIGGMMTIPEEARGMGPGWLGYIGVDDVDAASARLAAGGGTIHRPPHDIPSVGRFAVVADPQGAVFMLFTPEREGQPTPAPGKTGHVEWHELTTTDWPSAFAFYAAQFGWGRGEALDMGPMGTYQIFTGPGGSALGGMMNMPDRPRPGWQFYVQVDEIDAAQTRITEGGGTVVFGPQQVPGGAWIIQAKDPQGAMFAIVGPRG